MRICAWKNDKQPVRCWYDAETHIEIVDVENDLLTFEVEGPGVVNAETAFEAVVTCYTGIRSYGWFVPQ